MNKTRNYNFRKLFSIAILLIATCIKTVAGNDMNYHEFKTIDHQQGIDASAIYTTIQDQNGMIWMGTDRGLYSFDGYQARRYSATDESGQKYNGVIYCLQLVDSSHLWLGSDYGLLVFNTYTDTFEPIPARLPKNIRAIAAIDSNRYWLGSMNGLYCYNKKTQEINRITDNNIPHQAIYAILPYNQTQYLFGTYDGLCLYDSRNNTFRKIDLGITETMHHELILSLWADKQQQRVWIGIEGGLYVCNMSDLSVHEVKLFRGNSLKALTQDKNGIILAGTDNGLYIYDPQTEEHQHIRHDALNKLSLMNNVVWSVFFDREQNLWLGTDDGISLYQNNKDYQTLTINALTGSHDGNQIISLLADSKGTLWLGGTNGLIKRERNGKTLWYQQNNPQHPLPHNKVRNIFEDADGDIWLATDGSVCHYNVSSGQFDQYLIEDQSHTRNANWAYSICQDEEEKLWITSCLGGIFVADKQQLLQAKNKVYIAEKNYYQNSGRNGLSGNMPQSIGRDKENNIWVSTYREGLNKIDRKNNKVIQYTSYSAQNKLPSDDITALLIDAENYLWLAFQDQLIQMDTKGNIVTHLSDKRLQDSYINALTDDGDRIWISLSPGLFFYDKKSQQLKQVNVGEAYYNAIYFDANTKHFYAGGVNRFVSFNLKDVLQEDLQNDIYLSALWINNQLINSTSASNKTPILKKSIRYTKRITLPYEANNIALSFSEFKYKPQEGTRYAYQLQGYDEAWNYNKMGSNLITYNNLEPGEYTLLISRVGRDGNPLPQPLSFQIDIQHPWYATPLAKIIYYLLLSLLIFSVINYILIVNRLRFERLEKIKTTELTAHKIEFLTNISHELKTPLSLIIAPLTGIIEQVKTRQLKEKLDYVRKNALKMSALIHQMIEASRQEFDNFGLITSKINFPDFVKSLLSVYEKTASEGHIRISMEMPENSLYLEADIMKLEIILNNLLSNAFKYAPQDSTVHLRVKQIEDKLFMAIADEGPGIHAQDLPHVFERFYQAKNSTKQNQKGTGLGLAIVKDYVQMHRGSVQIFSNGIQGTRVEVLLPLNQTVGETDENILPAKEPEPEHSDKPLLLIVEDNLEILSFIKSSLTGAFCCITAQDGKQGLEKASQKLPDIIVTDIMMPVMDGMEMCRKLKKNIATAAIPIIMLTAKDDRETELKGYYLGIDCFIAKPFDMGYLLSRINSLIRGRDLLVQKARQELMLAPKEEPNLVSGDDKFLKTITGIIEENIGNPNLNVQLLSKDSGFSQKQLYRKLKTLTGQTTVDYIRTVRLKKAALLLSRKTFSVSEIMYMVGFSNHSYFSKRFQEHFGKSPKDYMEN